MKNKNFKEATQEMKDLLAACASESESTARIAMYNLAKALEVPLKEAVLSGDIVTDIYEYEKIGPGAYPEYPLDLLRPGMEGDFSAYTLPSTGRIPQRHVEGDYVMVNTYEIGSSIDFAIRYAREARWGVVKRAMQVLEGSFVRKMNTDGWRVILASVLGNGVLVYDDAATAGYFSKRLVELSKIAMRRRAGGNSNSVNRGKLTRIALSPEGMGDIRSWDVSEVDDFTRREIFLNEEQGLVKIFGVELKELDEFGVGQEFQNYFQNVLGVSSFPDSKVELAVGLDLSPNKSFVMPVKQDIQIFEDTTLHRHRLIGFYGWAELGFGCLDARQVLGLVF